MATDLSLIDPEGDANAGFTLTLLHPDTGEPLDARITVVGRDSTTFAKAETALRRRVIEAPMADAAQEDRDARLEREAIELLAACTTGWELSWEGQDLPFSIESAQMVYRARRWIRRQVDAAVMRRENFKRG
jgi:hypothetical protein